MTVALLIAVTASACTDSSGDCCGEPLDPETSRELELADDTWRDWAAEKLNAGSANTALVAAEADFQPQDWSLPPAFRWELTFLSTRPSPPVEVAHVLEKACAFEAGARFMLGDDLDVNLVVPGASHVVPSGIRSACERSFGGVATWLAYLDLHPFPQEIGGTEFSAATSGRVGLTAFVRPGDATPAVAARIRRHLCAYAPGVEYEIRSSPHPATAGPSSSSAPFRRAHLPSMSGAGGNRTQRI